MFPKKKKKTTEARPTRFDNLDASENAFFGEQLEQIKAQTYDRKYPMLKSRQYIPLDGSIDPATEVLRVRSYTQTGVAKLIASYADDLPRADVFAVEHQVAFRSIGNSYGYNVAEVRAASKSGVALDARRAAAARRAHEIIIDRVLASGDATTGLIGFLNQPNALTYTVPADGTGSSALWSTKTPALIVRDMVGLCEFIHLQTNEQEQPNMLLLPRVEFTRIRTTRFDSNSDRTILQWFQQVYPGVGVDSWERLLTAGAGSTKRMVAYNMSPDLLQGAVPLEFLQHPPEKRGLEYIVPCESRVGGVLAYYPLSIAYGDGI
jgi:hypothetical protein